MKKVCQPQIEGIGSVKIQFDDRIFLLCEDVIILAKF